MTVRIHKKKKDTTNRAHSAKRLQQGDLEAAVSCRSLGDCLIAEMMVDVVGRRDLAFVAAPGLEQKILASG